MPQQNRVERRIPAVSKCSPPELVVADLIAAGAEEVRPGVWISRRPKVFSDATCTTLKEFHEPRWLRKILWDDIVDILFANAYRRGLRVVKLCGGYVELAPKRRVNTWALNANFRLARRTKISRLFLKPYADAGKPVADVTLWAPDRNGRIWSKNCAAGADLGARNARAQNSWHGRHDPSTGEVSVAPPAAYAGRYLPRTVMNALLKQFGNGAILMDLIPTLREGTTSRSRNSRRTTQATKSMASMC
jgi:hypothetical protein